MEKIKNLKEVAARIKQAIVAQERIIIYADSDADGVCSATIMQEAIQNAGGKVNMVLFPNREEDGYGINNRALEFLKTKAPGLLITLDLGIGNVKEVAKANELGFEVIVIDHHEILESLPPASIVIDPKQPGDTSEMTHLANVGITFKLAEELLGENFADATQNSFLELAALATISDMVPQIGDNQMFIEKGLESLRNSFRPGLKVFSDILGPAEISAGGHMKIISCINAAESIDFVNDAFLLLTSSSPQDCRDLAERLLGKVQQKQQTIKAICNEVERRIAANPDSPIIFEGDPSWKLTLAGPVASIIAIKHEKPTFIYKKMDTDSAGSVRSLKEGENSVDAMKSCSDLLITFGGHPKASGFRAKNENLEKFREGLIKYFLELRK